MSPKAKRCQILTKNLHFEVPAFVPNWKKFWSIFLGSHENRFLTSLMNQIRECKQETGVAFSILSENLPSFY